MYFPWVVLYSWVKCQRGDTARVQLKKQSETPHLVTPHLVTTHLVTKLTYIPYNSSWRKCNLKITHTRIHLKSEQNANTFQSTGISKPHCNQSYIEQHRITMAYTYTTRKH